MKPLLFLLLCLALSYVGFKRSVEVNEWYAKCGPSLGLECM